MCNPLLVMAGGAALSAATGYKKTRDDNKNMVRQQNAKNKAFADGMERQEGYANEAGQSFANEITNQGATNFQSQLNDNVSNRLTAFADNRPAITTNDYQFASTPKNVVLAQNKAFADVDSKINRDNAAFANLASYDDALFNTGMKRNEYGRAFGNLSDKARRDSNLIGLDMNAASNNAFKPSNPIWSILNGAGNAMAMGGASYAGNKTPTTGTERPSSAFAGPMQNNQY